MTRAEYWAAHVAKNPVFADEQTKIRISVAQLRALLEEAYDMGSGAAARRRAVYSELGELAAEILHGGRRR